MIPRQKTSGGGYGHGKAICSAAVLLASLTSTSTSTTSNEAAEPDDKFKDTAMYPPLDAYKKGTLKVSDIHTIAYSCYGNPNGKPVLFVHGGPGGTTQSLSYTLSCTPSCTLSCTLSCTHLYTLSYILSCTHSYTLSYIHFSRAI